MTVHGELVPAITAAGGGTVMLGAIAAHEARQNRAMRRSRQTFAVVFPFGIEPVAAVAALGSLSGLGHGSELVAEVVADESGIHHLLHLPEAVACSVIDSLAAAMPGVRLDPVEPRSTGLVSAAVRIAVPVRALLRTDAAAEAARALLGGLAALREGERVSLRWALRPAQAPTLPARGKQPASLAATAELHALRGRPGQPGFAAAGLVLVRAKDSSRARELTGHVVSVLRSRRGVGAGLVMRRGSLRSGVAMPATGRSRGWLSAAELLALLAWPLGTEVVPGVALGAARRLPVPRGLPRHGRRLLIGRDPYGERPVALSPEAARHHLAVLGPSGTGKSALLARGILDDLAAGYGGVVVDPKADLVSDVLDRVPAQHADRVVVLDPAAGGRVPGLDLLGVGDPDLRSDVVLAALGAIFRDAWGVRTDTYLRLGLRTLAELREPVLSDWLRLFTDSGFRRQAVSHLRDPLLVGAWQTYESLSTAEQTVHVAAPMNRVVTLLSRPAVRAVLAQRQPRLDIARLLSEGKWLLVSLSPGRLGEPAARLLGSVLTYAVWTAIEARSATTSSRRRPVFLYLDELQSLSTLPFGVEHLFERARGLGCGVTVATQALGRLPDSMRQALLGNVASLVSFRLGYDEATRVARELPGLGAGDLQALRRFEVAARIGTGLGSSVATMTGRTEPLPPRTRQAGRIRTESAARYGGEPAAMDDKLRRDQGPAAGRDDEPAVGRTRRAS